MVSPERIAGLPTSPGVYQFLNAAGEVIYVGKAKSLRHRVRCYFVETAAEDAKTGSLVRDATEVHYILVDNEKEALALENNLIKRIKPRYNILLRDDKTYPYIKLTVGEKYPRVYVTRRLKKDGSIYYGPYFPAHLAHRLVHFIHRCFLVPSCNVDLSRFHPRPCLQFHIHRCLGPCVQDLTTDERYQEAVRDVRLFLEGRHSDLLEKIRERMMAASDLQQFEQAAGFRDLASTIEDLHERQKMAAAEGDDTDIFGFYREGALAAVNLFHLRNGRIVDRREFFWEDLPAEDGGGFSADQFFASLLKQIYLDQEFVPSAIHVPLELDAEFEDHDLLEEVLSEKKGRKVEIHTPQRGPKRALMALVEKNARHSFDLRFRVLKPTSKAISEALQEALTLPEPPRRIECFDISHVQGSDTVASMVVWEDGKMRKAEYRKYIIRGEVGQETPGGVSTRNDDFASMAEVVDRRYRRLQDENKALPGLVLVDGGLGQLHAAAAALEACGVINQPLAAIAKKEEVIYVHGQEKEPIVLDRHSPILHLVQLVRDEAHRFAVAFHRQRRMSRRITTELLEIPGVGEKTARKLLVEFGSLEAVRSASPEELARVAGRAQAARIAQHLAESNAPSPMPKA